MEIIKFEENIKESLCCFIFSSFFSIKLNKKMKNLKFETKKNQVNNMFIVQIVVVFSA